MHAIATPVPSRPGTDTSAAPRSAPLDGLRGWGTVVIIASHLGVVTVLPHLFGVLAVSMFFTLSGYLIAAGLCREQERHGRLDLRRFWGRRIRRLMPASVVTVGAVGLATASLGDGIDPGSWAALTWWQNWRLIASSGDYGQIFSGESPFTHFWSLAIEEQVYIVVPLLFVGLWFLSRRRWLQAAVLTTAAAVSFAAAWWTASTSGQAVAYYGTHTRIGEVLIGAAAGVALAEPAVAARWSRLIDGRAGSVVVAVLTGATLVLWLRIGYNTELLFHGGTIASAVITAVLVGVMARRSRLAWAARFWAWRPAAAFGRASYSIYLAHWPAFVIVDRHVDDATPGFVWIKLAAGLAAGTLLFVGVERPVQAGTILRGGRRLTVGLAAAVAATVFIVTVAPTAERQRLVDVSAMDEARNRLLEQSTLVAPPTVSPTVPPSTSPSASPTASPSASPTVSPSTSPTTSPSSVAPFVAERVMVLGDSISWTLTSGWQEKGMPWDWTIWSGTAAGATAGPEPVWSLGEQLDPAPSAAWRDDLRQAVQTYRPDVILVVSLGGDLNQHYLDGAWRGLGDPVYDTWLAAEQQSLLDDLRSGNPAARIAWFTAARNLAVDPATDAVGSGDGWWLNSADAATRLNASVRALLERNPAAFTIIDYASVWKERFDDLATAETYRPDGVHLDGNLTDVRQWVIDTVAALAAR